MLVALIRPVEKHTATVEGTDIPEMKPGGIRIVTGLFEGRHEPREIEAEDMDALHAKVPEGWQMLSVRRV